MLKKLLEIIGVAKPEAQPTPIEKAVEKPVVATSELTVKATGNEAPPVKKFKKADLNKMTKAQLEELGRAQFGVELDRRKKKDALVEELMKEQRSANKKG